MSDIPPTSSARLGENPEPKAAVTPRSPWLFLRRALFKIVRLAVLICIGFLAVVYWYQAHLIFSGETTQGQPEAQVHPRRDSELLQLNTPTGERVVALYGAALTADGKPDPAAASRPTMLFFTATPCA